VRTSFSPVQDDSTSNINTMKDKSAKQIYHNNQYIIRY